MNDLISRSALIDAINSLPKWIDTENGVCLDYADVIAVISEHLPSAQPEIIHCKDCKWWDKQDLSLQGRCALLGIRPTGGWFCANADMRGETG